jgi:hypothetical protein
LQRLLDLAGSLDAAATNAVMSEEFRDAARTRLMQRIYADVGIGPVPLPGARLVAVPSSSSPPAERRLHGFRWLLRGTAGLFAAVMAITATLTASASALPGEPLYSLKQAQEELGVRLAADDQARALALLRRADARLDETARLLQQGRTEAALETTQRYDQVVVRATTTYVVTIDDFPTDAPGSTHFDTRLSQQQEQLLAMLQFAPEPARADLREALVATERGRALVADPRPVEQALGRVSGNRSVASATVPIVTAEDLPTQAPTRLPTIVQPTPKPAVIAQDNDEAAVAALAGNADASEPDRSSQGPQDDIRPPTARNDARTVSAPNASAASSSGQKPIVRGDGNQADTRAGGGNASSPSADASPAMVARDDQTDTEERTPQAAVRMSGQGAVSRPPGEDTSGRDAVSRPPGEDTSGQGAVSRPPGEDGSGRDAVSRPPGEDASGQVAGHGGAVGQSLNESRGTASASPAEVRARDGEDQAVVARQSGNGSSVQARTTQSGVSSPAVNAQGLQNAPNLQKEADPEKEADRGGRDTAETRGSAPISPNTANRPSVTPTAASTRRAGSDGDKPTDKPADKPSDKAAANPAPAHAGSDHGSDDH